MAARPPPQATPEPVGEPVGTVVHAKLNGQAKPWVTVALNQDADLPDGTKLFTRPAPGVPDWTECLRISEAPNVDEALRLFAEGETSEDQAVCIVRAVIETYLRSKYGNV